MSGQDMALAVRRIALQRSWDRVPRERSVGSLGLGEVMVVRPWPRASRERMPAEGRRLRISEPRTAKERAEEPAPWWVTKRGPPVDGLAPGAGLLVVEGVGGSGEVR